MVTANPDGAPSPQTRVEVLGNIGPNWFASVVGTGIVVTAGAALPVHVVGLRAFAEVVRVIAVVLLAVLIVVVGGHWLRHPTVARDHARNPQMAHFYGAAPMALMTVGGGAVLVGKISPASASPSTWPGCCGPRARSAGCSPP
jgi:tellurite resistance protein TehA-like permease